ncbi:MAG: hypothetical protein JO316_10525 [Abitibacteriaceae bacterium]|nr:hypothetical protein [Abditibacteriaceae bacterium]
MVFQHRRVATFFIQLTIAVLLTLCSLGCHRRGTTGPIFDVPSLLGKNIDEVTAALHGATVTDVAPNGQSSGDNQLAQRDFHKGGQTLHVTYKTGSKKVTEFAMEVDAKTGSVKDDDKATFLSLANLKADDARYSIELTEDPNKVFAFTGIKVTPNPVSHHVVFSVTGTEFMTTMTYALRTNGSDVKTETVQNLPPWKVESDVTVAAADDTTLSLGAMPYTGEAFSPNRIPLPADYKVTLQIIVDGKVRGEATSTGFATNCAAQL